MKCAICKNVDVIAWDINGEIVDHLIITKHSNGHYHVHGCIDDKEETNRMINVIEKEMGPLKRRIPARKIIYKLEKRKRRSLLIID